LEAAKKIDKVHAKGKLTARERIELLLDPGSFNEFNLLIKHKIGAAGDGILIGHGTYRWPRGLSVCP
jgi:propionyl-CoA carboxylase beta chain